MSAEGGPNGARELDAIVNEVVSEAHIDESARKPGGWWHDGR